MGRLFFFLIFIFCGSCDKRESQFSFKPIKSDLPLLVSEIGQSLKVIEVQTKYPISGTPTILKSDKYFYLFEQGIVFSIHQIGLEGEVRKSIDFGFDDKLNGHAITQIITPGDRIGVITQGDRVTWFDEDLKEIGNEELPFKAKYHYQLGDQTIAHTNGIDDDDWDIVTYGPNGSKSYLPIDKDRYGFYNQTFSPFTQWNENVLFSRSFNDTIYAWDGNEFRPFFHVDFGSEAVSEERFLQIRSAMDMLDFFKERRYSYLQGEVFALDPNRILFIAFDDGQRKIGLMDFKKGGLTLYPGLVDNSISKMALSNLQVAKDGELFFGVSGEEIEENHERIPKSFKHQLSENYPESYFIYRLSIKED